MEGIQYLSAYKEKTAKLFVKGQGEGIILMAQKLPYTISYLTSVSFKKNKAALILSAKQNGVGKRFKKNNQDVVL